MELIKKLRDATGSGIVDCKKALLENNNDVDASVKWLREKGILKAQKKQEREKFGLFKTTMIKRISDNSTVKWDEETLPDKDLVRESLQSNDGKAPKKAHLQRKFSLTYNLRKRLRIGI